jgi:hypothetical protein
VNCNGTGIFTRTLTSSTGVVTTQTDDFVITKQVSATAVCLPRRSKTRSERRVRSCREDFSCSAVTLAGLIEAAALPPARLLPPRAGVSPIRAPPLARPFKDRKVCFGASLGSRSDRAGEPR